MRISICIPTYEQQGKAKEYLTHSLDIISRQTFSDFEVIVCDDSRNRVVKKVCKSFEDRLDIKYFRNSKVLGASANLNKAISLSKGELVKVLFMDDFLFHRNALKSIHENFTGKWMVTACEHSHDGVTFNRPFYPKYNDDIHMGYNTISSPSVLTIKRKDCLLFDESLAWLMDCDYYKRCYKEFGLPTVLNEINAVNRISPYQTTSNLSMERKSAEVGIMKQKYDSNTTL